MELFSIIDKLISAKSVTPDDDGALDFISEYLSSHGFSCELVEFGKDKLPKVKNLYARWGIQSPNFCFAGHVDVVPIGDINSWTSDPFKAEVKKGVVYGRGIVDMKGALAAMLHAVSRFIKSNKINGSISFLLTADEEGPAVNGTKKMLEHIASLGEKLDVCLVGEPTNPVKLGEMIKIGRRGSVNFTLTVLGVQGHVAYPENARNPIPLLMEVLTILLNLELDSGCEYFDPSHLEIISIDVGNLTENVIPQKASAKFNIRFNNQHTAIQLVEKVKQIFIEKLGEKFVLDYRISGEAFISHNSPLISILKEVIYKHTNINAALSTSGGTSDARFIKKHAEVIEFGLINKTAHQVDECCELSSVEKLSEIYYDLMKEYFNPK